jgi:hypothetical protein
LWKEYINTASLSKSFLISNLDCIQKGNQDDCPTNDKSLQYAQQWLDHQEKTLLEDDGSLLSTIQSAAGHGIESTSVLLTFYQKVAKQISSALHSIGVLKKEIDESDNDPDTPLKKKGILNRSTIHLPSSSPIWSTLMSNSTIYVHVVVVKQQYHLDQPTTFNEAEMTLRQASRMHSLLLGQVDLIKYDLPHHINKPSRILYHDVTYLVKKYVLQDKTLGRPPWDMEISKPEYYEAYKEAQRMKEYNIGYPYWKPEVAIKYLIDDESYPIDYAHVSGMVRSV